MKDYNRAGTALSNYAEAFPEDYMPHALRGILLITVENEKPEGVRNFQEALSEYEIAGGMLRGSDETSYYQQLGSLIENLRRNGWL